MTVSLKQKIAEFQKKIDLQISQKKIIEKEHSEKIKLCEKHNEPIEKFNNKYCKICNHERQILFDINQTSQFIKEQIIACEIPTKYLKYFEKRKEWKFIKKQIKGLKSYHKSFIICGNPGTGKTHFACDYLRHIITVNTRSFDNKCNIIYGKYAEALKIIRTIKDNWISKSRTEQNILNDFIKPHILIIDELGIQFGSSTEKQYLTEIINDRYNQGKQTILIANLDMQELTDLLGDRIIDRFKETGRVLVFDWPSYRGKTLTNLSPKQILGGRAEMRCNLKPY